MAATDSWRQTSKNSWLDRDSGFARLAVIITSMGFSFEFDNVHPIPCARMSTGVSEQAHTGCRDRAPQGCGARAYRDVFTACRGTRYALAPRLRHNAHIAA